MQLDFAIRKLSARKL